MLLTREASFALGYKFDLVGFLWLMKGNAKSLFALEAGDTDCVFRMHRK
jgi:hypothetical protein